MRHRQQWFIHLRAQRPMKGRWAPRLRSFKVWPSFTFTSLGCIFLFKHQDDTIADVTHLYRVKYVSGIWQYFWLSTELHVNLMLAVCYRLCMLNTFLYDVWFYYVFSYLILKCVLCIYITFYIHRLLSKFLLCIVLYYVSIHILCLHMQISMLIFLSFLQICRVSIYCGFHIPCCVTITPLLNTFVLLFILTSVTCCQTSFLFLISGPTSRFLSHWLVGV